MAQVSITFNKRTYRFDCADADGPRLEKIAAYLKDKLESLMQEHGSVGDERLMLMAAVMVTDELLEARGQIDELLEDETGKLRELAEELKEERRAGADPAARKASG